MAWFCPRIGDGVMAVRDVVQAAAGAGGDKLYVEDVFSTYLYTGNGATNQTITNNIDLSTEGGLVWIKNRTYASGHFLADSGSSFASYMSSNATNPLTSCSSFFSSTASGFTLTGAGGGFTNNTGDNYASWTFRKAPKFFDVVTWTGTGSARTIAHDLGSVPGMIMVKRTDTTGDWQVYHRANTANPETDYLVLNSTAATADSNTRWNDTLPTDAVFSLGTEATVNASGATYVAYLLAHDAGGFGDDGEQNVVSCGSYVGNGNATTGPSITLGWEPQWLLVKKTDNINSNEGWLLYDGMRSAGSWDDLLVAQTSGAESVDNPNVQFQPVATGFTVNNNANSSANSFANTSGATYIYIAIRRGPMKTPESGTEVYGVSYHPTTQRVDTGVKTDMMLFRTNDYAPGDSWFTFDRLRGGSVRLLTNTTDSESTGYLPTYLNMDFGYPTGVNNIGSGFASGYYVGWGFRRAPGFFDVTAHQSNGSPSQQINHNLGVVPEIVLIKSRNNDLNWFVFHKNLTAGYNLILNSTGAVIQSNTGTAAAFYDTYWTPGNNGVLSGGANTTTYIAYLFASVSGVSKVGSYTGTGTTLAIDCGFSAGARFVLIKRTDSTGDWYVWDTARGIVSGNDPYLLLNSTAAEVTGTDYIDPSSAGFEISSTAPVAINASGGSYIFLAIA